MKWKHGVDAYSNLVSFFWLFGFSTIFFCMLILSIAFVRNEALRNIQTSKVSILMRDFKIEKKYIIFDHTFFMLRRFFLIILLVFSWNHGIVQNILFSLSWVLVLIWKSLSRPFENKALNFQEVIFELFVTWIMFIYFRFMGKDTELTQKGDAQVLGIVWIVLIFMMVALNAVISIRTWIQKYKENQKIKANKVKVISQYDYRNDSSKNVRRQL